MNRILIVFLVCLTAASCGKRTKINNPVKQSRDFDPGSLRSDMVPSKVSSGQVLYLPVYSNIPYQIDTTMFDMSAFVAIHNTDLRLNITLTKVLYFNQAGKLVDDYLEDQKIEITPLATRNFYIPYEDQSGTGANFIIEWIADSLVSSPLVESVTLCLKPNNTVAILSQGKIISEREK